MKEEWTYSINLTLAPTTGGGSNKLIKSFFFHNLLPLFYERLV